MCTEELRYIDNRPYNKLLLYSKLYNLFPQKLCIIRNGNPNFSCP